MASNARNPSRHLDATAGTAVFCHACQHEWYASDAQGQESCPSCGSDAVELISLENDPRELYYDDLQTSTSPDQPTRGQDNDSDPEEADIEDHVPFFPRGFVMNQRMWSNRPPDHGEGAAPPDPGFQQPSGVQQPSGAQQPSGDGPQQGGEGPPQGGDRPPQGGEGEAVFRRFIDMVGGMTGAHAGMPMPQRHVFSVGGGNIRRTTFTSPDGRHTTSVMITSGPIAFGGPRTNRDEFPPTFRTLLGAMGPPGPPPDEEGEHGAQRDPNDLLSSLQDLLNYMVNPANARHGDAVYSQEALDRIISGLMEANPQSNAAPPASDSAIAGLEKRNLDEAMQAKEGGKADCTVCIDEIKLGEEMVYLPCKHWFHETCVTMWLKQHNTCPICRTAIEKNTDNRGAGAGAGAGADAGAAATAQEQGQGSGTQEGPQPQFRGRTFGFPVFFEARRDPRDNPSQPPGRGTPTSSDRDSRWPLNVGSRRSSMSPPNRSDSGSRTRTRSPSTNSRRSAPPSEQDSQREGSRPLGWLRDRFGGGAGRRQL